jgi:hypothetical protein
VNSRLTPEFLACFAKLPESVKVQARKAYQLWRDNTAHPSLQFKQIHGKEKIYAVRIGLGWRALGLVEDDTITWFWIGSHAEYDKMIG